MNKALIKQQLTDIREGQDLLEIGKRLFTDKMQVLTAKRNTCPTEAEKQTIDKQAYELYGHYMTFLKTIELYLRECNLAVIAAVPA